MPVVDITIVASPNEPVPADLAQSLADSIGRALKSPPGQTWVRLHVLAQDRYAENVAALGPTDLPIFVVVLAKRLPTHSELVEAIARITRAISDSTGRRSDRVHVEYAPDARGRASFGGNLIE